MTLRSGVAIGSPAGKSRSVARTDAFSLDIGDEHRDLRDWARGFAATEVRPYGAEWDEREETPWPVIRNAAEIGLYTPEFVEAGFADPVGLRLPIVIEEVAWGDAGIAMAIVSSMMMYAFLAANGTPEQCAQWLPGCLGTAGDPEMMAIAISEPDAGSDVSAIRTKAVYEETTDEWVLNGFKSWVSNGGLPGTHLVVATVDPSLGARGHAAFVVPPGTRGLAMGRKHLKMGIRASHTAEVILDDCRIPGSCLLGGREQLEERLARAREGKGSGHHAGLASLEITRPWIGAMAVGLARAAYEYALEYAKVRIQFGRPIVEHEAVAFTLADMRMSIDAARLLVWRACWMAATKQRFESAEGSVAKTFASETAVRVTGAAIQVLGGAGYMRDHPVERWHRDSKVFPIFEGTSEMQRIIIARAISGRRVG